jgi:putative endonuclease
MVMARGQEPRSLALLGMTGFGGGTGQMRQDRRYFVYIMSNPSRTLYTGITNSVRRRVKEHKLKMVPGFTASYNITRLVYFETFCDVRNAIEREKQIKAWTRAKRIALVESTNPKWDDLSREWDQPQTFRFTPRIA